jgi:hypothetical protein
MGIKLDSLPDAERSAYIHNTQEISKLIVYRTMRLWLFPALTFAMSTAGRYQKKVLSILKKFTDDVISERSSHGVNREDEFFPSDKQDVYTERSDKKRLAMLDLLLSLETKGEIDREGIREEVDTFLFEVSEENIVYNFVRNKFHTLRGTILRQRRSHAC